MSVLSISLCRDGDIYAALRDCHNAIKHDNDHLKAHFRLSRFSDLFSPFSSNSSVKWSFFWSPMTCKNTEIALQLLSAFLNATLFLCVCRCLYELGWTKEALECLNYFKAKFPDYAKSHACETLDRDIKAAIFSRTENGREIADDKYVVCLWMSPGTEPIATPQWRSGWLFIFSSFPCNKPTQSQTQTELSFTSKSTANWKKIFAVSPTLIDWFSRIVSFARMAKRTKLTLRMCFESTPTVSTTTTPVIPTHVLVTHTSPPFLEISSWKTSSRESHKSRCSGCWLRWRGEGWWQDGKRGAAQQSDLWTRKILEKRRQRLRCQILWSLQHHHRHQGGQLLWKVWHLCFSHRSS